MTATTARRTSPTAWNLCLIYLSWLYSTDPESRDSFATLIRKRDRDRRAAGIPGIGG